MNKKKLAIAVTSVILVAALGVGMTLAYFTSTDTAENVMTLGKIDVSMEEKMVDPQNPNQEIAYKDYENVKPGQTISKIPYITNVANSNDCYIRTKIEIENPANVEEKMTIDSLNIDKTAWNVVANADGSWYCYYNTIVIPNTTIQAFTEVKIPSSWGNEAAEAKVKVNVTSEAIQADNFTPVMENGKISGWQNENGSDIEIK